MAFSILGKLSLGIRFYLGFAPSFSKMGYDKRRLGSKPVEADFSGQTWLVTGASGGIGRAITLGAAARGAQVIAVARSQTKLDALAVDLPPAGGVETLACDLSLIAELRTAVETLARAGRRVDVLVNNVGVLLNDHGMTPEGFETSFATNLLGHYALTEGLLAEGLLAEEAQIIEMSSGGMYTVPLGLRALDVHEPSRHDGVMAYARHKRAQIALTKHWNARYGAHVACHVMHPGWVDTEGVKTSLPGFRKLFQRVLRNAEQGGDTALWLAAKRPAVVDEGIWLDRELRPEHVTDATRRAHPTPAELATFLDEKLASVT